MKRYLIFGLLIAGLAMVSMEASRVGGQVDVNPPKPDTVIRTYDIADLLHVAPDYPLAGDFVPLPMINRGLLTAQIQQAGGGAGGGMNQQSQAQEWSTRVMEITKAITDSIDTTSWKDNGGDLGSIWSSPLRARLRINTTVENHKAIEKFLDDLRHANRQVRIRADWLLLSTMEAEGLQKNGVNDTAVVPEISRDLIRALPASTVHYNGSMVCFDGQTIYFTSGRAKTIVTGVTPVVAPGAAAMDPTISNMHEGITLEVTPTVAADSVVLDLHSIVSEPNQAVNVPSTQPMMPMLEHIDSAMQDFRTTVRVPLDKPVLVGGSTADPNPDHPAGKQLYLIIQADIDR